MVESCTILIVDDEQTIRESLIDILTLEGFRVLAATNGLEAIELLREHQPDLILADIMMPEMNGYQFYQRVRQSQDCLLIPFIFLSAKGEAEDIRFGKELGADDYLMKPINMEDLISAILGKLKRFEELTLTQNGNAGLWDNGKLSDTFGSELPEALTRRELEVLRLMMLGMTNLDIAEVIFVELSTVKTHVSNILSKLGVSNRVEAVALAMRSMLDVDEA